MNIPAFEEIIEPNDQTEARKEHLNELRELVGNVYPNKFERSSVSGDEDTITNLLDFAPVKEAVEAIEKIVSELAEGERLDSAKKEPLNETLKTLGNVRVAGRLATPPRTMGKAAFVHLSDGKNRLQIYVRKQDAKAVSNETGETLEEGNTGWQLFNLLDHGDFVGVEGFLFLTNTGELSVHVEKIQFLTKAMLPMPDKMHGIADMEIRQRQRYADLIGSSLQVEHEGLTTREVFERRAKIISVMRRFLEDDGYIEVETPMLTTKATGAAAKPFETYHNALGIPLFARIAPELYLKRLIVGGFEKVYELNRNFRNEGISYKHNPEFTMLEFYCAYMDVNGMMDFCEEMIKESVRKATGGSLKIKYKDNEIDFSDFKRLSMEKTIPEYLGMEWKGINNENIGEYWLNNFPSLRKNVALEILLKIGSKPSSQVVGSLEKTADNMDKSAAIRSEQNRDKFEEFSRIFENSTPTDEDYKSYGVSTNAQMYLEMEFSGSKYKKNQVPNSIVEIFENFVEEKIINPRFIIDYPKSISPLSKASPENPAIAERFELFINGMECANGFSELNDPREQYERFADQMKEREGGDEEAMVLDEDYIRALSYGMPPAAGIGIGIDRIVMLLTNKHSIRDVILFPHLRPENKGASEEQENQ